VEDSHDGGRRSACPARRDWGFWVGSAPRTGGFGGDETAGPATYRDSIKKMEPGSS